MSLHVALRHHTRYRYERSMAIAPHVFRLRPAVHTRTPIKAYSLKIEPEEHFLNWQQDAFGNYLARAVFPEKAKELVVDVEVIAEMTVINPFDFFQEDYAEHYPFAYPKDLAADLKPYLKKTERNKTLKQWVEGIDRSKARLVDFLVEVNRRVHDDIAYTVRMEPGVQTCRQTLKRRSGSCRDSAWLLAQVFRHLGLASRFVSGYLVQLVPDEPSLDGPSGASEDFTDLHAWTEVYVPGAGWLGLDPTSGLFAGEGHIPLACSPTPASAAPVVGATEPCEVEFDFENSVSRVHEDPRVTKPYSEETWAQIDQLGRKIDKDLEAQDVRLSMGGEPTFVSIDDMDGAEWSTGADSSRKRALGQDLLKRLQETFASRGLLHHGEGKWYPGEPLPRWAYHCYWRLDGVPLWQNPSLLAAPDENHEVGLGKAALFSKALAEVLRIDPKYLVAGFEDAFYLAWKENTLPGNVDPGKTDLNDPMERQMLAHLLDRDLNSPTGYALPLKWDPVDGAWVSTTWEFRREQMFLIPGSSAMGYRLPLESVPHDEDGKEAAQKDHERSPLDDRSIEALGDPATLFASRFHPSEPATANHAGHQEQEPADDPEAGHKRYMRTALCVEPRRGGLYVFLPPVILLDHYVELVAAVEQVAASMKLPVVIEGYEPPSDHRLQRLSVTPDPGVIEVNIHPAASWRDLIDNTCKLYEQARLARLGTEKFLMDGRHTGTGGGNHLTLGGLKPADSPFLRRPSLLRSLLTYWQHHPGLSFEK